MMPPVLLDTDILSSLLRGNVTVTRRAERYLALHGRFTFSSITRYEVLRGLMAKNAERQLVAFEDFCAANEILPLTDGIIWRAAEIYGRLHQSGLLIGDADILIAATAQANTLTLATNNLEHFRRIPGLVCETWL